MKEDLFDKLIHEIEPYKTPIRLIRWGEPMLHPKLIDFIKKLKSIGSLAHINTNGSLLNERVIDELLDIPLDSIKFSFQGVDRKSYSEMRNIDFFDELMEIVKLFYVKRGERAKPFIHISTTITYETAEQVKSFRERIEDSVDLVSIGRTVLEHIDVSEVRLGKDETEMLKHLKEQETVVKKHPECPEVFDKLSINWDGTVSACCADYDNMMLVGDLKTNSLQEIWRSKSMTHYRTMLADMRHDELAICRTCYDYHGLQTPGLQNIN